MFEKGKRRSVKWISLHRQSMEGEIQILSTNKCGIYIWHKAYIYIVMWPRGTVNQYQSFAVHATMVRNVLPCQGQLEFSRQTGFKFTCFPRACSEKSPRGLCSLFLLWNELIIFRFYGSTMPKFLPPWINRWMYNSSDKFTSYMHGAGTSVHMKLDACIWP